MSWGSWSPFGGSRWSPFGRQADPHKNVTYVSAEDLERDRHRSSRSQYSHYQPGRYGQPPPPPPRSSQSEHEHDIIIIKNNGTNYPFKFPAYSIDDRRLTVGYVREKAADRLQIDDPDRLRMIHKGRRLDDDDVLFADLDFRSSTPSEILVTISAEPVNRSQPQKDTQHDDDEEEDEDEDNADDANATSQANGQSGGKKRRKNKKKKRKGRSAAEPVSGASPPLPYPSYASEHLPMPTGAHPAHRVPPSPIPTSPTSNGGLKIPSPLPSASANPSRPATPRSKLDAISSTLHNDLLPPCDAYLSSPPADPVKRAFEHKRLTETIMSQVMLKLDAVEMADGDAEGRARRKELVRKVQELLGRLDKIAGKEE